MTDFFPDSPQQAVPASLPRIWPWAGGESGSPFSPQALSAPTTDPIPPKQLNPAISSELDSTIQALLAKDPGSRPRSALEVIERLRAAPGTPPTPGHRGRRRMVRNALLAFAAVALAVACWRSIPKTDSAVDDMPDRKAAEYILSRGGEVQVNGEAVHIFKPDDLPKAAFRLHRVVAPSNQEITDEGLASFRGCKGIEYLNLGKCNNISDKGLANFQECKKLGFLNLSDCKVTDAGLVHFKDCADLWMIAFSNTGITDKGIQEIKGGELLLSLDLSATQVSDVGLASFKDCVNLKSLGLSRMPRVKGAGLSNFSGCKALISLGLEQSNIGNEGMAHLKGCQGLENLNLDSNSNVSSIGLESLKDCRKLKTLILAKTSVGDAGLLHLRDCDSLVHLDVRKTRVSVFGLAVIKTRLPKCKVIWDGGELK